MDNLTPTLNEQQLRDNIDALQKGGLSNDKIQAYVDNYSKSIDGNYVLKDISQTPTPPTIGQNYQSGKINAGDVVLQGLGEGARQTNEALNSPFSPIGLVTKGIGGLANLLGGGISAVTTPVAKAIGGALRNVIGSNKADAIKAQLESAVNHPTVQTAIKTYTSPQVTGDISALGNITTLTGTLAGAKAALEGLPDLQKSPQLQKAYQAINDLHSQISPNPTPTELTGKITQAKPSEIPTAKRALGSIDTTGIKTFSDLSSKLDAQIKADIKLVDASFGKSTNTYNSEAFNQEFKSGNTTVSHNFVTDAINHLEELYKKTNDPASLAKVQDLKTRYEYNGITAKEVNDLARQYGSEFGNKAFSKVTGEPLTSVNSQSFENTRMGVKESARSLMPDENTKAIDKQISDLIKTKVLTDKMATKVQQLQNKFQKAGLLQKVGGYVGKAVDIVSGGVIKGFFKNLLNIGGQSGRTLNAIELQSALEKNLLLLDKLNSMPAVDAIKSISGFSPTK